MVHAELLHAALHAAPPDAGPAGTQKTVKPGAKSHKVTQSHAKPAKQAGRTCGVWVVARERLEASGAIWRDDKVEIGGSTTSRRTERAGKKRRNNAVQKRLQLSLTRPGLVLASKAANKVGNEDIVRMCAAARDPLAAALLCNRFLFPFVSFSSCPTRARSIP
jgi:hypothetical protein